MAEPTMVPFVVACERLTQALGMTRAEAASAFENAAKAHVVRATEPNTSCGKKAWIPYSGPPPPPHTPPKTWIGSSQRLAARSRRPGKERPKPDARPNGRGKPAEPPPAKWSILKYGFGHHWRTAMPRKRHKPEEIVAKLRQVDVLVSQGQGVADAVRAINVSEVIPASRSAGG